MLCWVEGQWWKRFPGFDISCLKSDYGHIYWVFVGWGVEEVKSRCLIILRLTNRLWKSIIANYDKICWSDLLCRNFCIKGSRTRKEGNKKEVEKRIVQCSSFLAILILFSSSFFVKVFKETDKAVVSQVNISFFFNLLISS